MLWLLVKKQLFEVFKSYFYDAKKNRMRPKWAIAAWFVFFVLIMVGLLGGMFTALSLSICGGLLKAGMGWLYFLLMGGIAILLGAFGSVFNTYSGLYLAKDNDLLLSLPIPVRTILGARLVNVHLLGTMYAATALIPALIVYWVTAGLTASRAACGLLLFAIVTVVVLLFACALGWVVARISRRLKNKGILAALTSLLFIGAYYFFYFKANDLLRHIVLNAATYGARIRGASGVLYRFGRIGEGDWAAAALFAGGAALLFGLVWWLMCRSYLGIAMSGGAVGRARYVEKTARQKGAFAALLGKEFGRLVSSANYMLNCCMGMAIVPACGALLLIKGRQFSDALGLVFDKRPDGVAVLACALLLMLSSMIDTAAPSVSLEGKSLWILQSLPVAPKRVLRAKAATQLILAALPMLFTSACAALVVPASSAVRLLLVAAALMYTVFSALFDTSVGVRMPILNWTNEIAPIKQSASVAAALFGGWLISAALGGLYFLIGYRIGAALYLLIWTVAFAAASLMLLRWLDTKGSRIFAELG